MALYSKIYRKIWTDSKFRSLSDDGKMLFLFLLTCPDSGTMPGLLRMGKAGLAESLGWSDARLAKALPEVFAEAFAKGLPKAFQEALPEGFPKAFQEALPEGFPKALAVADWEARFLYLPNALKYNLPQSPNVVRSWSDQWDSLPECDLKDEAYLAYFEAMKALGEAFAKAFQEALPKPSGKPSRKPLANQEQDQDQEQNSPRGEQPPAAAPSPQALTLSGETKKPEKQKKLPLPKPSDPTAEAMGNWRKLWSEAYAGSRYVDPPGEFKQLRELVAKAQELAKEAGKDPAELIAHWFKSYLADPDATGFLRGNRHGLRWLAKEITKYGTPWDQEPRSGVFGSGTNRDKAGDSIGPYKPNPGRDKGPEFTPEEAKRRLAAMDEAGKAMGFL